MGKGSTLFQRGFRQGSFINWDVLIKHKTLRESLEDSRAISRKRKERISEGHVAIVLSQDCDIANENEKFIELVAALSKPTFKPKEVLQGTRNTSKLQLHFDNQFWLVEASLISIIPKKILGDKTGVSPIGVLPDDSIDILSTWRVNRYRRRPLPDAFNRAFFGFLHRRKGGLYALFHQYRKIIADVYADIVPQDEDAMEYRVSLTFVLSEEANDFDVIELEEQLFPLLKELDNEANKLNMLQVRESLPEGSTHGNLVCLPRDFTMLDILHKKRLTLDFLCWEPVFGEEDEPNQ